MTQGFCDNCGHKLLENADFCDYCGVKIGANVTKKFESLKTKAKEYLVVFNGRFSDVKNIHPLKVLGTLLLLIVLFVAYNSYEQTQQVIRTTSQQLQETKNKLNDVASSTTKKLTEQEQELSQKTSQIAKLESDLKNTANSSVNSSNVSSDALSSLSPSVVKIVCYSDSYGENLQMGSGVLYHSDSGNPSTYFVETNFHVIQTSDGSSPSCAIAVYPNYRNSLNYLVYKTTGYKTYKYGVDFAYLIPQIADSENAGTISDLGKYAKNLTSNTYCKSTSIGDHISILGYPSVGGSSLTATDGIISGFEYDSGTRFIKTSAKIEHGNSGGVAIKDSGCILGIPTFVETGSAESIGRILDLNDLFRN